MLCSSSLKPNLQRKFSYLFRKIDQTPLQFGPFSRGITRRWKKPVDSAQIRLENRTRDIPIDKLMNRFKKLKLILRLRELILKWSGQHTSVQLISKWRRIAGINTSIGEFLRKYPNVFDLYTHPVKKNLCCKICLKMEELIAEESRVLEQYEADAVERLKKLLMLSSNGRLSVHALWLVRKELGLRNDFRDTVLRNYPNDFRVIDLDTLCLVEKDEKLAEAAVEKWREKEYREKWLSEFETKFAFPIQFPTGFKIEKGFKEKLRNWQRLPYLKPYERMEGIHARNSGGIKPYEKRAVAVLHEFLSLTVEKMVEVERLSHFRRDFNMEVNLRELLLKHPGIFYISTKGNNQTVFLREAYSRNCLVEPNPVYVVRLKMLELISLGHRCSNVMSRPEKFRESSNSMANDCVEDTCKGDWVLPILENVKGSDLYVDINGESVS